MKATTEQIHRALNTAASNVPAMANLGEERAEIIRQADFALDSLGLTATREEIAKQAALPSLTHKSLY